MPLKDPDTSQRFLFDNSDIRGELVKLRTSYGELIANQLYPPAVARLLGEFVAASVLLATTIKFDGRLVLQAKTEGELSVIMAECTSRQDVRGIVRYSGSPQGRSFAELVGKGTLAITIEPAGGEAYQGLVSLEADSLASSLETYFTQSEQMAARFYFASDLRSDEEVVAGMIIQQLPPQLEKDKEKRADEWQHVTQLADTIKPGELLDLSNEEILHRLYHQEKVRLFEPRPVNYKCSCSKERTAGALLALGKEESQQIIAEQGAVAITCEFCGAEYGYGAEEIDLLFDPPENEGKLH